MKEKGLTERISIDCEKVLNIIIDFIRRKVQEEEKDGVCFGLSGGLDSSVLATIAAKAVGPGKTFALYLPDRDSEQKFGSLAERVAKRLGINFTIKEISKEMQDRGVYRPLIMKIIPFWSTPNRLIVFLSNKIIYPLIFRENGFMVTLKKGAANNAFARFIYKLIAAAIESGFNARHIRRREIIEEYARNHNLLLIGAANKSESFVGWFVKDGVDDIYISPLLDLYKTQIRQLAGYLGDLEEILNLAPSPDMWKGIGDEDIIGHTYQKIDKVAYCLENGLELPRKEGVDPEEFAEIKKIHQLSEWKRVNPHEYPKIN